MRSIYFTVILLSFSLVSQAQLSQGLVSKYCFNGDAQDYVGSNSGTVHGAVLTTDRNNNPNSAYSFDGFSGDYIDLGSSTSLKSSTSSISVWAYLDTNNHFSNALNYHPIIVAKNMNAPSSWHEAFAIGFWQPALQLVAMNYHSGTTNGPAVFSSPIQLKTWYHMVVTFDDNTFSFYLNGVLQGTGVQSKSFTTTYSPMESVTVGKTGVSSYEGYLNGKVDELRIYNRILSAQEVTTLYNLNDMCTPESVEAFQRQTDVKLFPNPAINYLQLEGRDLFSFDRAEIFNLQGQKLIATKPQKMIRIESLPAGMYVLKLLDKKNRSIMLKFSKAEN